MDRTSFWHQIGINWALVLPSCLAKRVCQLVPRECSTLANNDGKIAAVQECRLEQPWGKRDSEVLGEEGACAYLFNHIGEFLLVSNREEFPVWALPEAPQEWFIPFSSS